MKLEIKIPTELKEIKLHQYQKFLKTLKDNEDSDFLHQKMIQIFCNVELKYILDISYNDISEITNILTNMFNADNHKFINRFKIDGIEYGFIPNLEEISFGEYTDLDTYIGNWDEMNKAMAVLYRPIIKNGLNGTYDIEKYNGSITYSEIMKEAPLDVVFGANIFFYDLGNELLRSTMNYLETNKELMNTLKQHSSEVNGDGILQSMLLLKETLHGLVK